MSNNEINKKNSTDNTKLIKTKETKRLKLNIRDHLNENDRIESLKSIASPSLSYYSNIKSLNEDIAIIGTTVNHLNSNNNGNKQESINIDLNRNDQFSRMNVESNCNNNSNNNNINNNNNKTIDCSSSTSNSTSSNSTAAAANNRVRLL